MGILKAPKPIEVIEEQLKRVDAGMDFHIDTCEHCEPAIPCSGMAELIERRNYLYLAALRCEKGDC